MNGQTLQIILQIAAATVGTLGFAVLFNVRGLKLLFAVAGGLLSWSLFLLFHCFISSEALCYLPVALLMTFYSEIMARVMKTPNTTFILTSLIPLIPGGSLFNTMEYAFRMDGERFKEQAIQTLLLAAALAAGVILATAFVRTVHRLRKS